MGEDSTAFVGIDAAKAKHAVALAEPGRRGEVRYLGEIEASPEAVRTLLARLAAKHGELHVCYEAGPTGYDLARLLVSVGVRCEVIAPSLIPKAPGDKVKTDRRDCRRLARLHRAGELVAIRIPTPLEEAVRDLCRARGDMVEDLTRARNRLSKFLLRHSRVWGAGRRGPTSTRRGWRPRASPSPL